MLTILKHPINVFYKDDIGGKRNNMHIQFCSKHSLTNTDLCLSLMLLDNITGQWKLCPDQNILDVQGSINITKPSCIDVFFRITCVSYRYNNQPYGICIKVHESNIISDPFMVKSKSKKEIRHNDNKNILEKECLGEENVLELLKIILQSIQKTNNNIGHILQLILKKKVLQEETATNTDVHNYTDNPSKQQKHTISRNMSIESFNFVDDSINAE
jgi:hypothetical protein